MTKHRLTACKLNESLHALSLLLISQVFASSGVFNACSSSAEQTEEKKKNLRSRAFIFVLDRTNLQKLLLFKGRQTAFTVLYHHSRHNQQLFGKLFKNSCFAFCCTSRILRLVKNKFWRFLFQFPRKFFRLNPQSRSVSPSSSSECESNETRTKDKQAAHLQRFSLQKQLNE